MCVYIIIIIIQEVLRDALATGIQTPAGLVSTMNITTVLNCIVAYVSSGAHAWFHLEHNYKRERESIELHHRILSSIAA